MSIYTAMNSTHAYELCLQGSSAWQSIVCQTNSSNQWGAKENHSVKVTGQMTEDLVVWNFVSEISVEFGYTQPAGIN